MKKKLLALLLAGVMTCSLVACGKDTTEDTKADTATEESKKDDKKASKEEKTEEAKEEVFKGENEYYSITVENVAWNDGKITFDAICENKDDVNAKFDFDRVEVNGCIWYGGLYEDVPAGATNTYQVELRQDSNNIFDSVDAYAYTQPDEIKIYPEVRSEDYNSDKELTEPFVFYPTGKSADEVSYVDYTPKADDIVIIDDPNLLVCITAVNPESFKDIYYLYVENRTDKYIRCMLNQENYKENGEVVTPVSGWTDLYAGERQSAIIYLKGDEITSFAGTYEIFDFENDLFNENVLYSGDFDVNVADYDKD